MCGGFWLWYLLPNSVSMLVWTDYLTCILFGLFFHFSQQIIVSYWQGYMSVRGRVNREISPLLCLMSDHCINTVPACWFQLVCEYGLAKSWTEVSDICYFLYLLFIDWITPHKLNQTDQKQGSPTLRPRQFYLENSTHLKILTPKWVNFDLSFNITGRVLIMSLTRV